MPYRMRDPQQIADEFEADGQPYGVFIDNNLGSNRNYLRSLCEPYGLCKRSGAPQSPLMSPMSQD